MKDNGHIILRLQQPIDVNFKPQEDITAYELTQVLPYLLGQPMFEADWLDLGKLQRHFTRP